jgi:hypothetical protein
MTDINSPYTVIEVNFATQTAAGPAVAGAQGVYDFRPHIPAPVGSGSPRGRRPPSQPGRRRVLRKDKSTRSVMTDSDASVLLRMREVRDGVAATSSNIGESPSPLWLSPPVP